MSTDHLHKNAVEELNGDVTASLPRPLVAETTSNRNQDNHKLLKNSQTVADTQVLLANEKLQSCLCVWNGVTNSAR
jgi:hypothetical protein